MAAAAHRPPQPQPPPSTSSGSAPASSHLDSRHARNHPRPSLPTSSTTASLAPNHAALKRHSLFGTDDRIVLDIGARISKFGFSGEERPRAILESVPLSQPPSSLGPAPAPAPAVLWDHNIDLAPSHHARKNRHALLLARLTHLLRTAFFHHLRVDPKQRIVLVVENPTLPPVVKELISHVLLTNLHVPSVAFVPSHLMALVATGRITGLVVECGYLDTSVVPVYYGRPMNPSLRATTRAGSALNNRLRDLLVHHARYLPTPSAALAAASASRPKVTDVPRELLTEDVLEHIKAKALIVGRYDPELKVRVDRQLAVAASSSGPQARPQSSTGSGLPPPSSSAQASFNPFADAAEAAAAASSSSSSRPSLHRLYRQLHVRDEADVAARMRALKAAYRASSTATAMAIPLPGRPSAAAGTSSSSYPSSGFGNDTSSAPGTLVIPGWIRERAAELLFESGDEDDEGARSIVDLTVSVLLALPIDLRRPMCESILVTGGTAMMPGLVNRFRVELEASLRAAEERRAASSSFVGRGRRGGRPRSSSPAPSDGDTTVVLTSGSSRSGRMLHDRIAVLNDPWPRTPDDERSHTTSRHAGGTAPAFAANLLPYLGASLLGELKTSSLTEITREAYEEALAVAEKLRKAAATVVGGAISSSSEAGVTRPMLGPGNRGSFVGVVGGLETGAFGALAAVSRHLLVGAQQGRAGAAAAGGEAASSSSTGAGAGAGTGAGERSGANQLRSPTGMGPLRSPTLP